MKENFQWRSFTWTIRSDGKCPECGKATVCWQHFYMAERYARVLRRLNQEQSNTPTDSEATPS
ncbi:MAG: hypothetical protein HY671_13885 [Chloroflexi bacterium]|nr:hypothetical protein [Chloroflexota bacterium]